VPEWFWIAYTFAFGCCIGSFLNVVIYRLPRDKSLVKPPSSCPSCGKFIRFYDNIPLLSWLMLMGKCRNCKSPISPRYFIIELLTGLSFIFFFYLYFRSELWRNSPDFVNGGWLLYLITIILVSALIASSAIDLELWIIPLNICWVVTAAGIVSSGAAPFFIEPSKIIGYKLFPYASSKTSAMAAGAAIGLGISMLLLTTGFIKRSYETSEPQQQNQEQQFNHRLEVLREVVFLIPILAGALFFYWISVNITAFREWWLNFSQLPVVAGLGGSLFGYFIGCGIVWATRILGTLGFGKEAMGLGDVHLMGAAGAIVGPVMITVAFFIAPFFGLGWAIFQMFFKKVRQIPYGPFLSLGIISVIIFHSAIWNHLLGVLGHR